MSVGVAVAVAVSVGVRVGVPVGVAVSVGVGVGVVVGVGVLVGVSVGLGVAVGVALGVGVVVDVAVGVGVRVAVGDAVGVGVAVALGVLVGVGVRVAVGVGVGVKVAQDWPRQTAPPTSVQGPQLPAGSIEQKNVQSQHTNCWARALRAPRPVKPQTARARHALLMIRRWRMATRYRAALNRGMSSCCSESAQPPLAWSSRCRGCSTRVGCSLT
ncbi:MAG: hypothetical protein ACE5I7_15400 [Candidatus Binatia bacterium]